MKQIAVKDIAQLFRNAEIRVCGDGLCYAYDPDNPLDVAAYGNMCIGRITTYPSKEEGQLVNNVELGIMYEPVMCAG